MRFSLSVDVLVLSLLKVYTFVVLIITRRKMLSQFSSCNFLKYSSCEISKQS